MKFILFTYTDKVGTIAHATSTTFLSNVRISVLHFLETHDHVDQWRGKGNRKAEEAVLLNILCILSMGM